MSFATSEPTDFKRIYLWANTRSLGTIFLKCLSHVPKCQPINGMFTSCHFFGPESNWCKNAEKTFKDRSDETTLCDYPLVYDASDITYEMAKKHLEADYPGNKVIICKDLPFCLAGNHQLIPEGFRHTFLIRHPYKMYPSWKKAFGGLFPGCSLTEMIENGYHGFYSYKEQYEVVQHLINNPELGDTDPVIVDADDLQNHPKSVLQQYCQAVGVPFTKDMLQWSPGVDVVKTWKISKQLLGGGLHNSMLGFYRTAMESSSFLPAKKLPDRSELEEDILACADIAMPHYEALYAMRTIKP